MKTYTKRTPADICLLCQKNPADKTGSHIVSNMLTNGLFGKDKRGKIYVLDVKSQDAKFQKEPRQQTPVESYLFCSCCEDRMGKIETYIGNTFFSRHRRAIYKKDFPILHQQLLGRGQFNYLIPTKVSPLIFSLFAWMQLWRASVATHEAFTHIKLSEQIEEKLRIHLDSCLKEHWKLTETYCINNIDSFTEFVYTVSIPQGKFDGEKQLLGILFTENTYFAYAAGMLFIYGLNGFGKNGVGYNNGHKPLEIALVSMKKWDEWKLQAALPSSYHPFIKATLESVK